MSETTATVEAPWDVKAELLHEAGKIVNGHRRATYGKPENNFERIARFWQAYFDNIGIKLINSDGLETTIGPEHVSPLMRLMKEARLCETPNHFDSFCDIIGYALTGAEVNKSQP